MKPDWGERFIFMFNMDPLTSFHDYSSLEPVLLDPCFLTKRTTPGIYEHIYSRLMEISTLYFSSSITFREYSIYANLIDILTTIGREHYDALLQERKILRKRATITIRSSTVCCPTSTITSRSH